jgi:A/G-specific adenine glycosylase
VEINWIRRRLLGWYGKYKRDLPWRRSRDAYRVWISEIMLQQTRVAAVIPYYERFLERFPGVSALASAPEQELLAAWAGLGYYSRARNLQRAAQKIEELGGIPREYSALRSLPGIGDYTAAAIASIAFDLPHAVLDGNVLRVLSRLTGERGNVESVRVRNRLREVAEQVLDPKRTGEFNQALMELGALVCLPKQPQCRKCPVARHCLALELGAQNELPVKSIRPGLRRVEKELLVIERSGKILIWQRSQENGRLAGFWELPEPEQLEGVKLGVRIGQFRHTIVNTNFLCHVFRASLLIVPKGFRWLAKSRIQEVPLSTTAKKALACIED